MTAQWSADQATWPAHLRDDAPSQQCGRCGRHTYSPAEFGRECRMRQPDGFPCGGRFEPPGILLDLYAARLGAPVSTDSTTPLPEEYAWIGKGTVRLSRPEPEHINALLTQAVLGNPQLLIVWEHRWEGWPTPAWGPGPLPMHTIVGLAVGVDGVPVRMVAHRAGRIEHASPGRKLPIHATTISLETIAGGHVVTWYWRP